MEKKMHGAVALILLVFCFCCQSMLNLKLRKIDVPWVEPIDESHRKWDPRLFSVFSFGHIPATVDWLWLKGLMDPSVHRVVPGTHPKLYYDLDLLTDLDPAFYSAYIVGANLLSVIRNDAVGARDLLVKAKRFFETGIKEYPREFVDRYWGRAWNLSATLAYVYLFELNDMPQASLEFLEAARLPGAPPYLARLAKRLQAPGGVYEVGLKLIDFMMVQVARDERALARLVEQKRSLSVAQFLFEINDRFQSFRDSHRSRLDPGKDWELFVVREGMSRMDPWGGSLILNESGKVVTSTAHEKVFGLD